MRGKHEHTKGFAGGLSGCGEEVGYPPTPACCAPGVVSSVPALDAYALCGPAMSFRVSRVVNSNKGVYAFIAKSIFHPVLRRTISVV